MTVGLDPLEGEAEYLGGADYPVVGTVFSEHQIVRPSQRGEGE